jgi:hypothetical protein
MQGLYTMENLFYCADPRYFNNLAINLFRYQAGCEGIYRDYVKALGIDVENVKKLSDIPFLPIRFFKSHSVYIEQSPSECVFTSSGTTGMEVSKHEIFKTEWYETVAWEAYRHFFGAMDDVKLYALLPSYLERSGSSLVWMVEHWMKNIPHRGGFFLYDFERLSNELKSSTMPNLVIGVSFALMDFADQFPDVYANTLFMETGGMKGRKTEITRDELHQYLKDRLGVEFIASEYGMTELMSQAYSKSNGRFSCPPWMRVLLREQEDPFSETPIGKTGVIKVIDLANQHSCAFIETEDLGRINSDGSFEVLGRLDHSAVRGCNLMLSTN